MRTTPPKHLTLIAILAVALLAAGCGSDSGEENTGGSAAAPPPTQAAPATERAVPKALAENRAQANEILEEGALDRKLEELDGHPVVVNQWASWCPPCRAEFPYFQEAAEQYASDVAFLGIDMEDERAAAEEFLAANPVPYPSIDDPSAAAIGSLGGGVVSPTTVFIDDSGEVVAVFQGEYTSLEQLQGDIEKHLLS